MTVLGTVDLRAFDEGIVMMLNPELVPVTIDNWTRHWYAIAVPGVDSGIASLGGRVPIYCEDPEDVFTPQMIPHYRVARRDLLPAFDRTPWYQVAGRGPAADAQPVTLPDGQTGYTAYETQWRGEPYDATYDVTLLGRRREDAELMLRHAAKRFKGPSFPVRVFDSLGQARQYDAVDIGITNASEIADIADRVIGWIFSFTLRLEWDLTDPVINTAFLGGSALDPQDPLYQRYDLLLRLHAGVDPAKW